MARSARINHQFPEKSLEAGKLGVARAFTSYNSMTSVAGPGSIFTSANVIATAAGGERGILGQHCCPDADPVVKQKWGVTWPVLSQAVHGALISAIGDKDHADMENLLNHLRTVGAGNTMDHHWRGLLKRQTDALLANKELKPLFGERIVGVEITELSGVGFCARFNMPANADVPQSSFKVLLSTCVQHKTSPSTPCANMKTALSTISGMRGDRIINYVLDFGTPCKHKGSHQDEALLYDAHERGADCHKEDKENRHKNQGEKKRKDGELDDAKEAAGLKIKRQDLTKRLRELSHQND